MTWSVVNSVLTTSTTAINFSAWSLQDGDLLVLSIGRNSGQATTPSGWTLIDYANGGGTWGHNTSFYRIWNTGDATSVTPSGASTNKNVLAAFRSTQLPVSFVANAKSPGSYTSVDTIPAITVPAGALVIAATSGYQHDPTVSGGFTELKRDATTSVHMVFSYRVQATAGSTGTVTVTNDNGNAYTACMQFAFAESEETEVANNVTDTATVTLDGESVDIVSEVSAEDTGTVDIIESLTVDSAMDMVDAGTVSAAEAIDLASTITLGDSGTVSALEALTYTTVLTIDLVDAGTVTAAEDAVLDSMMAVDITDAGTVSVTEAISLASAVDTTDTGSVSATEAISLASTVSITDSGTVSATDTVATENTRDVQVTDAGTVSGDDTFDVVLVLAFDVTDAGTVSVAEAFIMDTTLSLSLVDLGTVSATELATLDSSITAADSGTVSATETASMITTRTVTDLGTVSATDSVTFIVTLSVNVSEFGTVSATDVASISTEELPVIPAAGVLIGARQTSYISIPRVWLSDIFRTRIDDLTPARAMSATAEYNDDYDTKRRATLTVSHPDTLRDLQDWILLETTIITADGQETTYNLGHFLITGRDVTHNNHGRQGTVQGQDLTWLLSQASIDGNYRVPAGTDHGAAARTIILERGIPAELLDIPDSGTVTTEELVGINGDRWWRLITDLLAGGAMYQPWVGEDDRLRSRKVVDIALAPAVASYRQGEGAKIIPPVQNRPDITRLRNRVTVRKVTPGEPTIQWTATVDDEGSRLHPANLAKLMGSSTPIVLGETYEESAIATEAEARQLAEHRLSVAGSFIDRLNISTYLDHTLDGHQILDVNLKDGHANYHTGNWLQRTWRVTLNGARASVDRELTRTTAWR